MENSYEPLLTEAYQNEEIIKRKVYDISQEITNKDYDIVVFVESLGFALTSATLELRVNGTKMLSGVLSSLPRDNLSSEQLKFVSTFYADRIKDHHNVFPPVLDGISAIICMKNFPDVSVITILQSLFQHTSCQSQVRNDREKIYRIFKVLSENNENVLKSMGSDFIYGLINSIDGERDPRNLEFIFTFMPDLIQRFSLLHLYEEMFEIFACYFPIDFTPDKNDPEIITRDVLASKLSHCLVSSLEFVQWAVPLALEKLESDLIVAKMDSLELLCLLAEKHPSNTLEFYFEDIWTALKLEIFPGSENQEVVNLGLQTLCVILKRFSQNSAASHQYQTVVLGTLLPHLKGLHQRLFNPAIAIALVCVSADSKFASEKILNNFSLKLQSDEELRSEKKLKIFYIVAQIFKICSLRNTIRNIGTKVTSELHLNFINELNNETSSLDLKKAALECINESIVCASRENRMHVYQSMVQLQTSNDLEIDLKDVLKHMAELNSKELYTEFVQKVIRNFPLFSLFVKGKIFKSLLHLIKFKDFSETVSGLIFTNIFQNNSTEVRIIALDALLALFQEENAAFIEKLQMTESLIEKFSLMMQQNEIDIEALKRCATILNSIVRSLPVAEQYMIITEYLPKLNLSLFSDLYIIKGLLGFMHESITIDEHFEKSSNDLIKLSLTSDNENVRKLCHHLLCSLFNKVEDNGANQSVLHRLLEKLRGEINKNNCKAVETLSWIGKGLNVRGFDTAANIIGTIADLLDDPKLCSTATLGFKIISAEYPEIHLPCVRFLFKQKFFNVIYSKIEHKLNNFSENHMNAFIYILKAMPHAVMKLNIEKIGPVVFKCLDLNQISTIRIALEICENFIKTKDLYFSGHLSHLVPQCLILTQYKFSMNEVSETIENHFASTHYINADGRFVVSLPFKNTPIEFGNSRDAALKRLMAMERRFSKDSNLKREYVAFMEEYAKLGHMTLVSEDERDCPSFYLPHHAILKPTSTTTKLRVVFDASCKSTNGFSLNDYLIVGPTIQNDLITNLVKFRKYKIAVKADIAKMYRQIWVNPKDTHFQRIVWRNNTNQEPRDYKLRTVTYGTASASFLATRVLKQIGVNNIARYSRASDSLINDFYVDDFMSTFDSVEDAICVKNDLCHILKQSGMDLRKWSSNSRDFLNTIDAEHQETITELCIDGIGVKTLGLWWNVEVDCFEFRASLRTLGPQVTKREMLSDIARVFDPLGWLSPTVVKMKIFMKRLWLEHIKWDESIPRNLYNEWSEFRSDLETLHVIQIPRWLRSYEGKVLELHGFADASESAYSAAVYSRVLEPSGIQTALICAKTRIAPSKPALTVPRLELCGSLLLTKLLSKVRDALMIHDTKCFAYTDSTIVLHWIRGYPRQRNVFIDNRVSQIVRKFPVSIWHHVRTAENPADCATRGIMPHCLSNLELWWNGPRFLRNEVIVFSTLPEYDESSNECTLVCLVKTENIKNCEIASHFSNLNRLLRVVTRCILLFRRRHGPNTSRIYFLSPQDLNLAKIALVRISQARDFVEEIDSLRNGNANKSKYRFMDPFIDEYGVLRVGGRLENASIPFDQRHPIILHKDDHLTNLIVSDCHKSNMHAGIRQMTYLLHLNYFILGAHHVIKRCVYKCPSCVRQRGIPYQQRMGNLPSSRLEPGVTFGNTGVDYAGPFIIRSWRGRGAKQYKAYVALFICMATKAMHLELVTELSSAAFIAALRRFVARRGKCHTIFSDNGTNFTGANQALREWANLLNSTSFQSDVTGELTTKGINWIFSPPHAPHFGGLWEAGVKTLKFHLRRVMTNTSMTYEEFSTILCQIEACANSRPLCALFEGDADPLTPAHFLISRPLMTVPDPTDLNIKISLSNRWQYLQSLVHGFWRKWSQDYINQLRKRPKWLEKSKNLKVDDLVLIKDENQPPCRWLTGRIVKCFPGQDGLVRVVTVATAKGELKRSINKLCPLLLG